MALGLHADSSVTPHLLNQPNQHCIMEVYSVACQRQAVHSHCASTTAAAGETKLCRCSQTAAGWQQQHQEQVVDPSDQMSSLLLCLQRAA